MVYELTWKRTKILEETAFKMLAEDCKAICNISGVEIHGGSGEGKPEFSEERILFNGIFNDVLRAESFCIRKNMSGYPEDEYGLCFEFSKICNHPYGIVSMACLIVAKYHFGNQFILKGSGEPEEWAEAFKLAMPALGSNPQAIIDSIFEKPTEEMKAAYRQTKEEEHRKEREGKPERHSIDTADVAKLVRKDLKAAFPGVKFSVRIERYAGGSSINVNWTNGPAEEKVEAVAGHYCAGDFNGMDDIYEYNNSPYCNHYIFFRRDVEQEIYVNESRRICKEWGITLPENVSYNDLDGYLWNASREKGTDLGRVIGKEIQTTDYY